MLSGLFIGLASVLLTKSLLARCSACRAKGSIWVISKVAALYASSSLERTTEQYLNAEHDSNPGFTISDEIFIKVMQGKLASAKLLL